MSLIYYIPLMSNPVNQPPSFDPLENFVNSLLDSVCHHWQRLSS